MASILEVIIRILSTIISSLVDTSVSVISDLFLLAELIALNIGRTNPVIAALLIMILIGVVYGVMKMFKSDIKTFAIAAGILLIIFSLLMLLG